MILQINQTKTNFDMEWVVSDFRENVYAIGKSPFEKGQLTVHITYTGGGSQSLYYNPQDTTWGSRLTDRMSFKLFEEGEKVGAIVGKTRKTGFLKAYPYYEFDCRGTRYYGYEVGFGGRGLFLCLYRGEELTAIVDKKLRVVSFKDTYTAYLLEEAYAPILLPFVLYYDCATYGDAMEVALVSVKEKRVNTLQKELIAKYDPDFIRRVLEKEETKDVC